MGPWSLVAVGLVALVSSVSLTEACNEAVCASLVSKCMLLKSCECNMLDKNNCTCCRDCHKCLATLYTECCSCVGMCPEKNTKSNVVRTSTVEELPDPVPALFSVLTEDEDELRRWTTYTYPAHLDLLYFQARDHSLDLNLDLSSSFAGEDGTSLHHGKQRISTRPHANTTNCTVAYMAQCMSLTKCRDSCQSMGAARYRWFHQYGCCECIGGQCLDYGKGEPLCLHCPPAEEEDEEDEDEEKGGGGLAAAGGLDKQIRVNTLGAGSAEPAAGLTGRRGGLSGGRLDSAAGFALGDESLVTSSDTTTTKKHRKHKAHHKHHGKH